MQAYIAAIEPVNVEWTKNICLKIFFAGCNFKCPFCNTPHLLETKEEVLKDLKDVKKEIELNGNFTEAVIFTGGEPCLQRPQLVELAKFCREKKIKVGIETNGSKPEVLRGLLKEALVDFVAIDIKAPFDEALFEKITTSKTFFISTNQIIQDIKESLEILHEYKDKVDIEARTIIVPSLLFRKEDVMKVAEIVNDIDARWVIQRFNNMPELVKKNFEHIHPPSTTFLEDLKEACGKKYPNLRIEIK
ncbi:anaerobic ribonucleoside-triphosphate reductase activating protein [Candidatus Woesearchaeota archaeon]|nr:anaerobic ribonucleoside-triphosphate reductase activating protein [Candidatus Woesearchaeota archaeon]